MSCNFLQEYFDGRLQDPERGQFEAHAQACDSCGSQMAAWREFEHSAQAWGLDQPEPSAQETAQLLARVEQRHGRWRWTWIPLAAVPLAAAAALFLLQPTPPPSLPIPSAPVAVQVPGPAVYELTAVYSAGPGTEVLTDALVTGSNGRLVAALGPHSLALGAGSRLELRTATDDHVELVLQSGLAAFEVEKSGDGRPFVVRAGTARIQVIGTRFSVETGDELRVQVAEGTVEVLQGSQRWLLHAGEGLQGGAVVPVQGLNETLAALFSKKVPAPVEPRPKVPAPVEPKSKVPVAPTVPDLAHLRNWVASGEFQLALPPLRQVVANDPSNLAAWRLLASAEAKAGNRQAAAAAWEEIAERGRGSQARRARFEAAVLLQELGSHEAAATHLQAWLADPAGSASLTAEARLRLADSLSVLGRQSEANEQLGRIVRDHPGSAAAAQAARMLASP
jgi:ferric-dicitrate binding protein FerR (iron transport regulator)